MFLSYLTLFIALCLSAVAAFYSIAGLTAIFAAAVVPIIIMGSILEVAKIVTTLWLHEYWRQAKLSLKMYLVPAVAVLMLMTSMGIFGFLSKAHLDQSVPVGDVAAQVSLFDEKIKNERDTIANARTLLGQLDKAVNDISAGGDREITLRGGVKQTQSAAERALQVRRQQARDRAALTKTIEDAQARIVKLQEERAPIASQARKVEAEVGPVKYVAALIYGDNPDANTLERAVRWVIIMIVVVFDPLAIMMLLAATESIGWVKALRKKKEGEDGDPIPPGVPPVPNNDLDNDGHDARVDMVEPSLPEMASEPEPESRRVDIPPAYLTKGFKSFHDLNPVVADKNGPPVVKVAPVQWQDSDVVWDMVQPQDDEDDVPEIDKGPLKAWKAEHPNDTLKRQRTLVEKGIIPDLPWKAPEFRLEPDDLAKTGSMSGFGTQFPAKASKGDIFLRVDRLPSALYKFNGIRWIEIDKKLTDTYAYDDSYIDYLIDKIDSGEYDPELLNDAEREQIERKLNDR